MWLLKYSPRGTNFPRRQLMLRSWLRKPTRRNTVILRTCTTTLLCPQPDGRRTTDTVFIHRTQEKSSTSAWRVHQINTHPSPISNGPSHHDINKSNTILIKQNSSNQRQHHTHRNLIILYIWENNNNNLISPNTVTLNRLTPPSRPP